MVVACIACCWFTLGRAVVQRNLFLNASNYRVFNNADDRKVIYLLLSVIDMHQKTDLDYARAMGMHAILRTIMDYSGIFSHTDHPGATNG
jgi:hypothetical protein